MPSESCAGSSKAELQHHFTSFLSSVGSSVWVEQSLTQGHSCPGHLVMHRPAFLCCEEKTRSQGVSLLDNACCPNPEAFFPQLPQALHAIDVLHLTPRLFIQLYRGHPSMKEKGGQGTILLTTCLYSPSNFEQEGREKRQNTRG